MLRKTRQDEIWFVTQPEHAALSGYLAAHWGNKYFVAPGCFATVPDPEALRAEVVFGIGQHDNGWWEWEASPEVDPDCELPLGLSDVLKNRQTGMDRWRRGIPRFAESHPYAALLISWHAYWLYAFHVEQGLDPTFCHPLFGIPDPRKLPAKERQETEEFLAEIRQMQSQLVARMTIDSGRTPWLQSEHLYPHVRLLQVLDGISLAVCSNLVPLQMEGEEQFAKDSFQLADVPRSSWVDRVTISIRPLGARCIALEPYPFDQSPLPVSVPTRVFQPIGGSPAPYPCHWYSQAVSLLQYEFVSA